MKLKTLKSPLQTLAGSLLSARSLDPHGIARLRGRAAVDRRAKWLRDHPLCKACQDEGRVTAAAVVDHITPLWQGGADDYESNGQSLCKRHHDAKTAEEAGQRARGG